MVLHPTPPHPTPRMKYVFGKTTYHGIQQISPASSSEQARMGEIKVFNIQSPTGCRYFIGNLPTLKMLALDMGGELSRVWKV